MAEHQLDWCPPGRVLMHGKGKAMAGDKNKESKENKEAREKMGLDKDKVDKFEKSFREATGAPPRESPSPSPSASPKKSGG